MRRIETCTEGYIVDNRFVFDSLRDAEHFVKYTKLCKRSLEKLEEVSDKHGCSTCGQTQAFTEGCDECSC